MANMKKIIEESFSQYAGAVLQSRALVDVRDCIKPSARQIFYCLYTDKFLPSKPFKKTLKAIGSAARMYIHGDSSCEGVIMRAGQPFAMRYPLIEIEGNEGNLMQSGNWAAPRYTASRLSKISEGLFNTIEKETINDWRDNYDDTEQYPTVLPSRGYYNIVNGTQGIGIGAASSIPQFNIRDVNKALETLLLNPDCSFDDIYCPPDFCTGGILLNEEEVKESLRNGRGNACKLRSVVEFDNKERCLIVTQIPYSVYTNTICGELENILNDEEHNPGIDRFNDLTGITPLIKIYLTKKATPERVLRYLYKNTSLQSHYGINMTMLEDGRFPKVFRKFIKESMFLGPRNAYVVATCAGSPGDAYGSISADLKRVGISVKGFSYVIMPTNYLLMFNPPGKEEASKIIAEGHKKTIEIGNKIKEGQSFVETPGGATNKFMSVFAAPVVNYTFKSKKFKATDKCVGCGSCALLCPFESIRLENNKPTWRGKCTHCMACIGACPNEAIEYGNKTQGRNRYYLRDKFEL